MHFLQILYFTAEMEKVHAMESVAVLVKYLDASIAFTIFLLPPSTKLGEGYIFTGICDSVHSGVPKCFIKHICLNHVFFLWKLLKCAFLCFIF